MVNLLDLAPTIADITNIPLKKEWQGSSLLPLIKDPDLEWKYFVRYHKFKALVPGDGSPMQLFNMAYRNQVNEETNVAKDYPEVPPRL